MEKTTNNPIATSGCDLMPHRVPASSKTVMMCLLTILMKGKGLSTRTTD